MKTRNIRFLSGNALKIIAALSMLIDHIGVVFYPGIKEYRIAGRLALPIFAFMIAEGCKHTKNKLRYFLSIATLATVCQIVYYLFDGELYFSILVTFSLSILVIYAMQFFQQTLFEAGNSQAKKVLAGCALILTVMGVYELNRHFTIDYGFWGCMLPVFASLLRQPHPSAPEFLKKADRIPLHVCTMAIGMAFLTITSGGVQIYSFLALPFLFFYSGMRGKRNMKYFFYLFYPLHLAAIQGVYLLIE